MTVSHFHKQMEALRQDLAGMGILVKRAIQDAARAFTARDFDLATQVVRRDRDINMLENSIEERCITLLATQQPVASDLRFLTTSMKICNALERMADQGVNLAQRAMALARMEHMATPVLIEEMAVIAVEMTDRCVQAYQERNLLKCHELCDRDDDLDELNHRLFREMVAWMTEENRVVRRAMECILAARHLEKIGDGATDIAEEVFFLVEGRSRRVQANPGPALCDAQPVQPL
ncbi:MAG: phosphate signaling complex protein PhoU [Thermodesulfobacteriota bacterium]